MDEAFQKIQSFKKLAQCVSNIAAYDSTVTYKIVHYISDDHTLATAKLRLASTYVADRLIEYIKVEDSDEAKAFLGGSEMGYAQSTVGNLFEAVAHGLICENGLPALMRLPTPAAKKSNKNGTAQWLNETLPESFTVSAVNFTNTFPQIVSNISTLSTLTKGIYYQPEAQNQASFDSFSVIGNSVFAYQLTNAEKHPVKAYGLIQLHELIDRCFSGEVFQYHLVFVCPAGKVNTNQFKWQNIDLQGSSMPDSVIPFAVNQWIAKVEYLPTYLEKIIKNK
jgi:hypothetical protein